MDSDAIYASDTIYSKHGPVFLLWACRETGVIEALLDSPKEPTTLAEATGITDRAAEIVLEALLHLGYVERDDGDYRPTDRLAVFDPDRAVDEKGILPHRLDSLENYYLNLPTAMETGEYPDFSEDELRNYVGGMASIDESVVRAGVTVAERAHPRPQRVLDVGGGYGRFGREFAQRGANVTLVDRPGVIDIVRQEQENVDLELVPGDVRESLPSGFDLAFCGRVTEALSATENKQLFENVYEALDPGGTVVGMAYVRGRSQVAKMFGVHMLGMSPKGNTYSEGQYRSWSEDTGFVSTEITDIPATDFQAIIAQKSQ